VSLAAATINVNGTKAPRPPALVGIAALLSALSRPFYWLYLS
jgi:hypothetical protein